MKLEILTVNFAIDPGFIVEGATKEEINAALAKMFNYDIASCMSMRVDGIGYVKAADDAVSVHADDIEDYDGGGAEAIDQTVSKNEKYAEFKSKQGALFGEEEVEAA